MQCFLITAYKDFEQIYELATYLSENNKVYIHIDASSKEITKEQIEKLNCLGNCQAISTYAITWGSFTHIEAILELLRLASKDSDVTYVHLITAQDLPVVDLSQLEQEFINNKHIYLDYISPKELPKTVTVRYRYYNWFVNKNVKNIFLWQLQQLTVQLQKLFFIKRKGIGEFTEIYKGLVYVSMPQSVVYYVLEYCKDHPEYLKDLKYCQVPEEFFFQTLLLNSEHRDVIIKKELRYMNWEKGDGASPAFLDESDYVAIKNSGCVFARKFQNGTSDKLKEMIMKGL